MPEPLTSEILTQTVLQVQEGGLPVLNHQDAWRVTPDLMAAMERLMAIVNWVRSPAGGWPPDRGVDPESLLPYVMDEALDVLDCLEKSWMYPGLPMSHPFFPLQKLLNDRLILSDAVSQLLWGVARSSVETMQLLGGIPAELFQAGKEWTPGILRLMAILTIQTPNFQWQMDLVTAAPPLPELHPDSLLRWSNSIVFWAEGLLQTLQGTIAQNTLPLQNLLTQAVPSEIIAPSQPWQKGTLHLSLGFTFAPHATKPVLSVLPSTLAVAEPPKPDWNDYRFSALTPGSQGMASIPLLAVHAAEEVRDGFQAFSESAEIPGVTSSQAVESLDFSVEVTNVTNVAADVADIADVVDADIVEVSGESSPAIPLTDAEVLFDENWLSGLGAPSPEMNDEESVMDRELVLQDGFPPVGFEEEDLFGEHFADTEPVALTEPIARSSPEPGTESIGSYTAVSFEETADLFDSWGDLSEEPRGDRFQVEASTAQDFNATEDPNVSEQGHPTTGFESEPDFEIVLDATLLAPQIGLHQNGAFPSESEINSAEVNPAEIVLDETESWNLDQWTLRWSSNQLESDRLQLPRSYHVKTLLHRLGTLGKFAQPSLNKEHHLVEIIDLACEALKLPDPPPTLLNTDFVPLESSLATLVHRLTWELIRNSYGITCLLSGIPAQILQPEWGWESGVLRLLPILKVQSLALQDQTDSAAIDLQVDLGTGAPAPLETILLLPDILVSIDGSDWQQTRESAVEFRSSLLKQIYQLLPELEVLCCPVPVELATTEGTWQPATVHLQFELGFQGT